MSRLTVRLPDTLHQQIELRAEEEGVSMNQYIVFALTRQVGQDYNVQQLPEKMVAEQRAHYRTLLDTLGRASFSEIQEVLNEREQVEPELGLTPDVVDKLRQRIAAKGKQ
ncbi:MAG TPA: toxin-antitoxin system HicB family antitoxin [Anaerolineales bacterium]|nr:toxin-antitoxin system HicB family antitoxin [Anaerolineales bacterium]